MKRTAPTHTDARPEFRFTTPLTATATRPALYAILIPARVSAAIGRRGPIPIVAVFNQSEELHASLVPIGGGRHRLQLNARLRAVESIDAAVHADTRVRRIGLTIEVLERRRKLRQS